jgi:hypothetical protein
MARRIVNIGSSANDSSGDPLRTAFDKINNNFTELYSGLPALSIGATPPTGAVAGQQWWNNVDGNSYIYYSGVWVPSTSTVALQTNNVRNVVGNAIVINFATDGIITTAMTSNLTVSFVNFAAGESVKVILTTTSTGYIVTHGTSATNSTNGSTTVAASVVPSTIMLEYICTGSNLASVYVEINKI